MKAKKLEKKMAAVKLENSPKPKHKPKIKFDWRRGRGRERRRRKEEPRKQRMVDKLAREFEELDIEGKREREQERLFLLQGVGEEDCDMEVVGEEPVFDEREEFEGFGGDE